MIVKTSQVDTRALLVLACLAALSGVTAPAALAQSAGTVTVHDAWIRQPVGDRSQAAAFAVVENSGAAGRAIVSAIADVADTTELHEMKMTGSMMRMSPVTRIDVPARGKVELRPGGLHLMLFGLKPAVTAGDTVMLTLAFDDGTTVSAKAAVRRDEGMRTNEPMPQK
jgi:copper(I)-binding protein